MNINKDNLFYAGLLAVIVIGFFGLCNNRFLDRRHFEEINNRYEICLEYSEIASVCSIEKIPEIDALALFRTAGITAISFFPDENKGNVWQQPTIRKLKKEGFRIVARPKNPFFYDGKQWENYLADYAVPEGADYFLSDGDEAYGYPDKLNLTARILMQKKVRPLWLEFTAQKGGVQLGRLTLVSSVKSHSLDIQELVKIPDRTALRARFIRAVKERNVRLLYLHLLPEYGLRRNIDYIRSLKDSLAVYRLHPGEPIYYHKATDSLIMLQIIGLCISVLIPVCAVLFGLYTIQRLIIPGNWLVGFCGAMFIGLMGYMIMSSLVAIPEYMSGLYVFRGVKLAYLAPIIILGVLFFRKQNYRIPWNTVIKGKHIIVIAVSGMVLALLVMRSGNYNFLTSGNGFENSIRFWLERFLSVRPRTKEFLFGYPLLLVGFWLYARYRSNIPVHVKWICIMGSIGFISMINTSLHAHTPLSVSLLRTFYGIGLGFIVGIIIIIGMKVVQKTAFSVQRPAFRREKPSL